MGSETDRDGEAARAVAEARRRCVAGDAAGAFGVLKACVRDWPGFAPAYLEAADILLARSDRGGATQVLSDAMTRTDAAGRAAVAPMFATLLAERRITEWHPRLEADVLACLAEASVDAQGLARTAAALLLAKYPTVEAAGIERLASDGLLLAFLARCLNVEPAMEAWIDDLREVVATEAAGAGRLVDGRVELAAALAVQAFAGEYLLATSDAEAEAVVRLRSAGDAAGSVLIDAWSRPVFAMETLDGSTVARIAAGGEAGALLVKRTLADPREERRLAEAMPTLVAASGTEDTVSTEVRRQYEANPYPRWLTPPPVAGRRLGEALATLPGLEGAAPIVRDILIAGCGTGYEAIDMARMELGLAVTALDLSRASLAYGQRMSGELGVTNIDFRQGNILDLATRDAAFDLVTCTGVLHHMEDTAAGLAALRSVLRPGGLMRIALYSERARAPVRAAHAVIAAEGLAPTVEGVRSLRRIVLAAPMGSPLEGLATSDDLHSVSGCRDLVFHAHERRFSLLEVADLLGGQGLELVGFDAPPEATAAFQEAFGGADPLDLALWDGLEQRRPFLFAGMYHLWCRKPG